MARVRAPYNVRYSYSVKQLVSEVRTREKMCLDDNDNTLETVTCPSGTINREFD